ncbi:MAG TPA: hypothetical protein VGU69_12515 [Rhizomicrobium sp.]|nr:hypothetical protein [Rhizomicrobium sp.]
MNNKLISALAGVGVAALLSAPLPALAADAHGEAVTAATHADLAAKAADMAGTQMHMHHVLNCLVGPGGKDFDAKNMNPCANSGNGAIPDQTDPVKKAALEHAADDARKALAATDLASAQSDATATAAAINAAIK